MAAGNVVLIGFMGAGKTAVGERLARRLGFECLDTDAMVAQAAGRTIADIFRAEGENGFRARETEAVTRACAGTGRVISCGGGAILQIRNYAILRGAGPVVYLRASADTLRSRVGDGSGRPLLAGDVAHLDELLAERAPAYESAADHIVDTDGREPDEVAAAIEGLLS